MIDDGRSRCCCYVSDVFVVVFFIHDSRIQLKHRITDSLINLRFPDFWFDEKVLISHQGEVAVVVHQGEVFRHQLLHLWQKFLFQKKTGLCGKNSQVADPLPPPLPSLGNPCYKKKIGFIFHFRTSGTFLVFTKKSQFWPQRKQLRWE